MVYPGSKNKYAKELLEVILANRTEGQYYVEPFCGGCNVIDKVTGNRMANDLNKYIIALFKYMIENEDFPQPITKEEYKDIRANKDNYPDYLVGFAGIMCTFNSRWMGSYSPNGYKNIGKDGKLRIYNYIDQKTRNTLKQKQNLIGVEFTSKNYYEMDFPPNSIIYCDAPYKDTYNYKTEFDFDKYYNWIKEMTNKGHTVFFSEYEAPSEFECVLEIKKKNPFKNDLKSELLKTEKLFIYNQNETN